MVAEAAEVMAAPMATATSTATDILTKQIGAWATKRNVRLMCNEFGVYRRVAPASDRARWIGDVRTALEMHGIGWTMWDYAGDFGLVTKQAGQSVVDDVIVSALGLDPRS